MVKPNPLADNLWEIAMPLVVGGLALGARTTLIRVGGDLLVHSPGPGLDDELAEAVAALGAVRWLVAPNWMHHRFLGAWSARWPAAEIVVAPGMRERLDPRLPVVGELAELGMPWDALVETRPLAGMPRTQEVVFVHRPSGHLLLTDIAFNVGPPAPLATRIGMRLNGAWNGFGPSRLMRYVVLRDRRAFAESLRPLFGRPFEGIVPAHGAIVSAAPTDQFREAFAWLYAR